MKLNYRLRDASIFISAIAMLFGAPTVQAETLASTQLGQDAIAANINSQQVNNQIKQNISIRAADLLTADDPSVTLSDPVSTNPVSTNPALTNQVPSPSAQSAQYSFQPMSPSTRATSERSTVTPTNEAVFTETYGEAASDSSDSYLSQADTSNNDDTSDNDTDGTSEDTDTLEDGEVYEETDEGVFDGEDGLFEDEDTDDGDGDDVFEDAVESVSPGRATRSGQSYVGIGGNIGLGDGETALGEGSFAAFSKIGLTRNISVRPAVLINSNPTILLPVTFDFIPGVTEVTENVSEEIGFRVSPFIGAGAAISTGDDGSVDFLATGGVDVPLGDNFTGVAAVNVSLFNDPAVGLLLGIGVNFPALR